MSKKHRLPIEDSFTLQFGEPEEDNDVVDVADDVFVDDNFMWHNATAFLDTPQPSVPSSEQSPEQPVEDKPRSLAFRPQVEAGSVAPSDVNGDANADVGPAQIEDAKPGGELGAVATFIRRVRDPVSRPDLAGPVEEDNVEPLVVDERQAGAMLTGPQGGVDIQQEDVPDDDPEPMVLDERQMAMVTAPERSEAAAFVEPDLSELRADPSHAILPRKRQLAEADHTSEPEEPVISGDHPDGVLFVDDLADDPEEAPVLAAEAIGQTDRANRDRTPWAIYGTLGLGLLVLGVAGVGMLLQLGKPVPPSSAVAGVTAEPDLIAPVENAPAAGLAAAEKAIVEASDLDPQVLVPRLVAETFVDGDSHLSLSGQRSGADDYAPPAQMILASVDAVYAPDLSASLPVALLAGSFDGFGTIADEAGTANVVTVSSDRIELDLSLRGTETRSGERLTTASIASVTVDPQVRVGAVPQLAAAQSAAAEESPQDVRSSRGLFETIAQLSDDVAALDVLAARNGPDAETSETGAVRFGTIASPVGRADLVSLSGFDLPNETTAGALKTQEPVLPVAAVRLSLPVSGNVVGAPASDALLSQASFAPVPGLKMPGVIAGVSRPEPNLPEPTVDVSRQLLAAVQLQEEEKARAEALRRAAQPAVSVDAPEPVRAVVTEVASRQAPLTEVAVVQDAANAEQPAITEGLAPVADPAPIAEATEPDNGNLLMAQAEPKSDDNLQVLPKEAEIKALAAVGPGPVEWLSEAVWVPVFGFAVSTVDQNGQSLVQVSQVSKASVLPDWALEGAEILAVNGTEIGSEAELKAALLGGELDEEAGLIKSFLDIRARAGLDPRQARIDLPVWRSLTLGQGTELSIRQEGSKWVTVVSETDAANGSDLRVGDVLLRDFMSKNKLDGALDMETLLEALTVTNEKSVEFAVMRDGELASGGLSLAK